MDLLHKKERSREHHEIVTRLHETGHSTDELANSFLAVMVISVNLSLTMTNTFDLFFGTDLDASLSLGYIFAINSLLGRRLFFPFISHMLSVFTCIVYVTSKFYYRQRLMEAVRQKSRYN